MAVETFHHPQLNSTILCLSTRLKLRNLGVYSHKCCHGDMPWWCWIVLRVSSNVVWTLYEVFEELGWQWRHFITLNSTPPFCASLSTRLKLRNLGVYSHKCCHGDMPWWCWIDLRVSSNVVWTLYEVFEELGWQWRHFITLNSTPPFCASLSTRLKLRNLGVYSHKCCHGDMPWWCWIVLRVSSNVVWTLYEVFEELGWQWRHFITLNSTILCLTLNKTQTQK